MNEFLTFLIAVLAFVIGILPSTGSSAKIYDNSNSFSGFDRLRPKGRWIVAIFFLAAGLGQLQSCLNDKSAKSKEDANKRSFDSSLAVMQSKFDSSLNESIASIVGAQAEALGKYGYKYDSSQRVLVKIVRDSSKTKVIKGIDPVLNLCPDIGVTLEKHEGNKYQFFIRFCSEGAGSTNFKMPFHFITEDSSGTLSYKFKGKVLTETSRIAPGKWSGTGINITQKPWETGYRYLYFYTEGTYTSIDNSKPIPVNNLYGFDLSTKQFGDLLNENDKAKVINYLKAIKAIK